MKTVSLPRKKSPFLLPFFLFLPVVFSLTAGLQFVSAQQSQLSLVDIIAVLRSKKVTIEERNKLLTEGVKTRGITFAINADLEKELRTAGADESLIDAIRQKSPVVKVTTVPQPKTEPVSTPKPPDYSFYQNRGNSKFVMGEFDAAIGDYSKAIELNAKEPTVYFSRALAYYNLKNFNLAIADYDKAIELDPQESTAYFNRGNALEKVGNFEKALTDYQKAVELDATNEPAKNSLQRLQTDLAKLKPPTPNPATVASSAANQPKKEESAATTPADPSQPYNIGSLKSLAVRLAVPTYPAVERQRNVEGLVVVEVVLDEKGDVVSAKATSGPRSLRSYSEDAARKSKFKPATVDNKPVKSIGFINYNFKAN